MSRLAAIAVAAALFGGCAHAKPPPWLSEHAVKDGRVCAWGIAGRAYHPESEAPKALAVENGVRTLAGAYLTAVVQSEISRSNQSADVSMRTELVTEVPEDVLAATAEAIREPDVWRDPEGVGPLGPEGRGYTYARVCIEDPQIRVDPGRRRAADIAPFSSEPPDWLEWLGSQDDATMCALGFSLPVYDPATIFANVEEAVRAQLIEQARTWVVDEVETHTRCRESGDCAERIRAELAITTEAISRGVVLTHFWYDWQGAKARRGAWGWGCVYRGVAAKEALARVRARLAGR